MKQLYPHLVSRILLYLRQQRFGKEEVLTEDIIKRFKKSKSRISQALSVLTKKEYIVKIYIQNYNNHGSRQKILLTPKGLEIAEEIIFEGLDPLEKEVIEALKLRFN